MNKKGIELSLILIPIVALVFCLATIFAFLTFKGSIENKSEDINNILSEIHIAEERVLISASEIVSSAVNCDKDKFQQICSEEDLKKRISFISTKEDKGFVAMGNFFGLLRTGEFEFEKINEGYVLKMDNLFIQSVFGKDEKHAGSKIKRNFDLEMKFNEKGEVVSKRVSFTQDL